MTKKLISVLLCISVILSLTSCGSSYKKGGSFTYLLEESVTSLDPQTSKTQSESTVINALFEGLCRIDEEDNVVQGVAKKWESNGDYTQFIFYLRDDAKWSNGTPVTAHDFVYGIQRALNPDTKSTALDSLFIIKNARQVNQGELDLEEAGVYAADDYTVIFELEESYECFPELTASVRYMPCNQEYFEETKGSYGINSTALVSNGPFKFVNLYSWDPASNDTSIELAKSSSYGGKNAANPESLTLLLESTDVKENPTESLLNGTIDLLKVNQEDAQYLEEKNSKIISFQNSVYGLLLNYEDEYLKNSTLREIFIKTLDRDSILDKLPDGTAHATGIMPPAIEYGVDIYSSLSTESIIAQKDSSIVKRVPGVLRELELNNAETVPSITIICPDDENSKQIANSIIVSWNKELSNSFNIEPLDEKEFASRINSGNYQAALYTLTASGTSAQAMLKNFSSSASVKILENSAVESAVGSLTLSFSQLEDLERTIMEEYVFYPISYQSSYYALSPNSIDIFVSLDNGISFIKARTKNT